LRISPEATSNTVTYITSDPTIKKAGEGNRTLDVKLGKLAFYR
jgi:hypothetical protein